VGLTGRVLRVNPRNGHVSTFASGLPPINPAVGIGGAMDVAVTLGGEIWKINNVSR
jgi:hypothetical protein